MLRVYLQLFRVSNIFTAVADITAGFLFVQTTLAPFSSYVSLVCSSCFLYTAGMVLNDVYDYDVDRQLRPERPLPSGKLSIQHARNLGYGLLLAGISCGFIAAHVGSEVVAHPERCGVVVCLLAALVVGYDRWLKPTLLGPLTMGLCRAVNLLLGMSIVSAEQVPGHWLLAGFQPAQLVAAAGLGTYITGVTLFARQEAQTSSRLRLLVASAVLVTGIGFLSFLPDLLSQELRSNYASRVPLLTAVLALLIGWRCFRTVVDPSPRSVQNAIKVCLMSIIVLDAVICLCVSDAAHALGILSLLIPTMLLGKWFSPT